MKAGRAVLGAASIAVALGTTCTPAFADEASLQKQIQELNDRIRQLEGRTAPAAAPATREAPSAGAPGSLVIAGSMPGSFVIPGTATSLKIGGYARLDIIKDTNGGAGGSIMIPQLVPLDGSAGATRKGFFNMNARQSRFYIRTQTPTAIGDVVTHLEGDFYGAGGNEVASNSSAFRLRHAYIETGSWLAGQTWWNSCDLASLSETLDFSGGAGGLNCGRASQLRYTWRWAGADSKYAQQLSLAAENPESDINGAAPTVFVAASGATNAIVIDKAPDVSLRYVFATDWGRMSFAGIYRHLTFNNNGSAAVNGFTGESSKDSGIFVAQGRIKTFGDDSVQYGVSLGNGAGRYILNSIGQTAGVINNGALQLINQQGYVVGYQHFWSPAWRSNFIYGWIHSDYPHPALPVTTYNKIGAGYINLIWSPVPNSLVGIEWNRTDVKNQAEPGVVSNKGHNNRIEASFQYGF
jgi:hypothetical protein